MKFFNSEKDHFSEKTFYTKGRKTLKQIIIKIDLENALKSNSLGTFFEKVVLLGIKEFHGLQDDGKII